MGRRTFVAGLGGTTVGLPLAGSRARAAEPVRLGYEVTHNVAEAVYLADRIVVLTPHPGAVKTDLPIGLSRMRDPLRVEFLDSPRGAESR